MVTESAAQLVKQAKQLKHKADREEFGMFLAEGPQVVAAAITAGVEIVAVFVSSDYDQAINLSHLNLIEVSEREFKQISDTVTPQGVIAMVRYRKVALEDLEIRSGIMLYLEEIRDPGNLGTMIRTADAFGADAVVLSPGCVDPTNDKVVRSSAGSVFNIPIVANVSPKEISDYCSLQHGELLVTELDGKNWLSEVRFSPGKFITWAVCNEANGASAELTSVSSASVRIPMVGGAESLNAAVAAAVCLYVSMVGLNLRSE